MIVKQPNFYWVRSSSKTICRENNWLQIDKYFLSCVMHNLPLLVCNQTNLDEYMILYRSLSLIWIQKIKYLQIDIVYSTSFLSVDTEKSRASWMEDRNEISVITLVCERYFPNNRHNPSARPGWKMETQKCISWNNKDSWDIF